jgi:hypothetical protein
MAAEKVQSVIFVAMLQEVCVGNQELVHISNNIWSIRKQIGI